CLDELNARDNQFGDEGAKALAGSKVFQRLQVLDVSGNGIGPIGIAAILDALTSRAYSGKLRSLNLKGNGVSDDELARMISDRYELAPFLREIDFGIDSLRNTQNVS
ncbi:MAG TPA: hypothetical protein DF383_09520, partial [Deltaproteobacteria bacterium]|nr:hypothetical protein [Deltaproteobacteria bacterium]